MYIGGVDWAVACAAGAGALLELDHSVSVVNSKEIAGASDVLRRRKFTTVITNPMHPLIPTVSDKRFQEGLISKNVG